MYRKLLLDAKMSRFHEYDGENPWGLMWNANIRRILRGKRGQRILREFIEALLALPERRLIANALTNGEDVCAVACYARHKGVELPVAPPEFTYRGEDDEYDSDETVELGEAAGLGFMLAWELGNMNDNDYPRLWHAQRYVTLDVPVITDEYSSGRLHADGVYRKTPSFTRHGYVSGGLHGYTPEERWQKMYQWATKLVRWNLPALAT